MAENIVSGLFGVTPEMYQQRRQQQQMNEAVKMGSLTPEQFIGTQAYRGGQAIGNLAGGLLGVEDPELAKIRDVQALRGQFDISTPDGLRSFAQALSNKGYGDLAVQASSRAADIDKELSQAEKNRTEKLPSIANLQLYRDRLIKAVGPNDPRVKEVNAAIDAVGRGQGTVVNIDQKGESAFVQELAKNDAGVVKEAMKTRNDAINSLKNLNTLSSLNDQELISGTYASGRVGAANLFNTLGLATKEDANRLATSEQFQKIGKDLILQTLGGKLGAGFSNEDRKFIEGLIPSLENSPTARRQLITFMQTKFGNIVTEVNSLETYARNNKGLGNYQYKTPLPSSSVSNTTPATPTKAEAEAELKRRGVKL